LRKMRQKILYQEN